MVHNLSHLASVEMMVMDNLSKYKSDEASSLSKLAKSPSDSYNQSTTFQAVEISSFFKCSNESLMCYSNLSTISTNLLATSLSPALWVAASNSKAPLLLSSALSSCSKCSASTS